MKAPTLLSEKTTDGEATGAWSTSRVLAWLFAALAALPAVSFFLGVGEAEITFWKMLAGSATFGVLSVGFYAGLGAGAFAGIVEALKGRISRGG